MTAPSASWSKGLSPLLMALKPGFPANAPGSLVKLELPFLSLTHLTQLLWGKLSIRVSLCSLLLSHISPLNGTSKSPKPGTLNPGKMLESPGALNNNNTIRVSEVGIRVIFLAPQEIMIYDQG